MQKSQHSTGADKLMALDSAGLRNVNLFFEAGGYVPQKSHRSLAYQAIDAKLGSSDRERCTAFEAETQFLIHIPMASPKDTLIYRKHPYRPDT